MAALAVAFGLGLGAVVAELGLRWQRASAETSGQMDPGLSRYHRVLGWELTPGARVRHTHPDYDVVYTVNADGYRGTAAPLRPPAGQSRVVVLGDSFTFGLGADDADIFTEVLNRRAAPERLFLNFAVPGTSTDQQLLLAEDRAFAVKPDLVVLVVYLGNDLIDNTLAYPLQADVAKPYFALTDDGTLALRNVPVPRERKPPDLQSITFSSVVLGDHQPEAGLLGGSELLRRLGWRPSVPDITAEYDDRFASAIRLFGALIQRLDRSVRRHGARLVVVLLPGKSFVEDPEGYSGRYQEWARRTVLDRLAAIGVPTLDVATALHEARAQGRRDLFHPNEGHLTAAGHAFVADRIAAFLPPPPSAPPVADDNAGH